MTLRTDRLLAEFFKYLDQHIGLANTVIVLTADHGAPPIPEHAREYGLGGRINGKSVTEAIEQALSQRFGNEKWVVSFVNNNVYFDYEALTRHQLDRGEVERAAAQAVLKIPGIAECFTKSQLLSGQLPLTQIARSVANGFYASRSGDLVIVPKPYFLIGETVGTTHGTPYSYDTHVPVIFYGARIAPGEYFAPSSPADIAPTLAALLRIEPPSNYVGRILSEAITDNHRQ
jgi:arylsulfatase A-like enzyme